MEELNIGELIFGLSIDTTDLSESIKNLMTGYNDELFDHVAIYIGNGYIIEAVPEYGVRKRDISNLLNELTNIYIGTIYDDNLNIHAISFIEQQIGKPYNNTYIYNGDSFYCSELIHKAYELANNNIYFKQHSLTFKDSTNEIMPYWKKYYEELELEVPEGMSGSHPANLSLDKKLSMRKY